ncbi:MAG: STAS domain-containing protein [Lamprobacter sp.]|uniref:STAS domain-containing protein n=1 Tax=Lamprobacter sp. TaxID=3100796 RepID=UPI002B2590A2|nr:STAS domain-containing protein [Lamprobacter sp.]MEA3638789.1 STAS domain-containing protein [Lamprobacter sp.]
MLDRKARQTTADQTATLTEVGPGQFALQGSLSLSSIPALARQGGRMLKAMRAEHPREPVVVVIDLSGVNRSSSAGVALLLDWVEQAVRDGISLRFQHWPEAMVRIATFSNVEDLLGIEAAQHG